MHAYVHSTCSRCSAAGVDNSDDVWPTLSVSLALLYVNVRPCRNSHSSAACVSAQQHRLMAATPEALV
jgi:hypothetical protein